MSVPRILHYPGSKWALSGWIIDHMPPHRVYLEPFFGSGAVFFNKEPSAVETINDLDGDVVNLFRVIRERPSELAHVLRFTPYARDEYRRAHDHAENEVEMARRFMVRCWQAIRPKTNSISGWRCRATERDAFHVKQWNSLPDSIDVVSKRLRETQIENVLADVIIRRYRGSDVLIFADPPYVLGTRYDRIYKNEMNDRQHIVLLEALNDHPGPVLITGYAHPLYDERLSHWQRHTTMGKPVNGEARTEVLWINPVAAKMTGKQMTLF